MFSNVGEKPVVSLNRGFSSPIRLTINHSHDDLLHLAANDSDPFNRWQALQSLATALLIGNVAAVRNSAPTQSPDPLIGALRKILNTPTLEPAFRALLALDPGDAGLAALDASTRRFVIFEAVKRLLIAVAGDRPVVLLIEDLHWVDRASDEFLAYVVDALAASRTLLVCTHRPGYRAGFAERSFATRIALQPLNRDETARMAAGSRGKRE